MSVNFPYKTKHVILKSVKLVEEKNTLGMRDFYLDVTYTYFDEHRNKHEINYPKIRLAINETSLPTINQEISMDRKVYIPNETIDLGFGDLQILRDSNNIYATDQIVDYFCKEMTLEEIQSKLGHKVKIVDKKTDVGF